MSYKAKNSQNVFKMSEQRYRSDGLADENFPQTPSDTPSTKVQQNHQAQVEEQFSVARKRCPKEAPTKTDGSTSLATRTNQQRRNSLESSSHIVREVGRTVNQMVSYEEEALDKIEKITKDIEKVYKEMEKVEKFEQMSEFKKFEEFFLQKNIELDNVDPKNNEQVREFRKAAVRYVQDCMYNLDQKQKISIEM